MVQRKRHFDIFALYLENHFKTEIQVKSKNDFKVPYVLKRYYRSEDIEFL